MINDEDIFMYKSFLGLYIGLQNGEKDPDKKHSYDHEILELENKIDFLTLERELLYRKRETDPERISQYDQKILNLQNKVMARAKYLPPRRADNKHFSFIDGCEIFSLKGLLDVNLTWRQNAQDDPQKVRQIDKNIIQLQEMLMAKPKIPEEYRTDSIVELGNNEVILDGWTPSTINGLLALNAVWRENSCDKRKYNQKIQWLRNEYTRFMKPQTYYGA